jgi:ComF family protein
LFFPRLCEGCSQALLSQERILCISCIPHLAETDYHHIPDNETALRFAGRVSFQHATSFAYFSDDGLLQHLMHGLKYKGRKEIGTYLGAMLGQRLSQTDWAGGIDVIIPVPLHPAKKAARGYNQSMLIAEGLAGQLMIPASDNLLQRVRHTESQTRKTRIERVNNMSGAFVLNDMKKLEGAHVLLCDDVLTTGATLEACALALTAVKDIKISLVSIGIAIS